MSLNNINKSYIKLLLSDDFQIPYVIIDNIDKDLMSELKELHNEYLEYSFEFPYKILADARFVNNICEITYLTTVNYVPRMNKKGRLFSLEELQEREIEIEDYYGEIFAKSGTHIFRQSTTLSSLAR